MKTYKQAGSTEKNTNGGTRLEETDADAAGELALFYS